MSRPAKKDAVRLSHVLPPVRCTEAEKETIRNLAEKAGMSMSEYVRRMATEGEIVVRQSAIDFEATQQLRKIGVNLNQQTKKLNSTGVMPYELKSLWQKLDTLLGQMLQNV